MDLALDDLQRVICLKIQPANQPTNLNSKFKKKKKNGVKAKDLHLPK